MSEPIVVINHVTMIFNIASEQLNSLKEYFLALLKGESVSATSFLSVPVSITLGAVVGVACGYALVWFFKHKHMRDTVKVLIILSFAFLLNELEHDISHVVPFSG